MEEALSLLRRAEELLRHARSLEDEDIRVILYAVAMEAIIAAILSSSTARRSKRLCTSSTKRLINMALVELGRVALIDAKSQQRLRRVLQALRCRRNTLLHPWRHCIRERCEPIAAGEAEEAVSTLLDAAKRLLGKAPEENKC